MNRTERDSWARNLLLLSAGLFVAWMAWGVLYDTTGIPGVNYLSFGLVSPPLGLVLAALSLASLVRAARTRQTKRYAVSALAASLGLAIVPWIALLSLAEDYS